MRDWAFQAMNEAAMALPPSDFGSYRAVEAAAELLRKERAVSDELLEALKRLSADLSFEEDWNPCGCFPEPDRLMDDMRAASAVLARAEGR